MAHQTARSSYQQLAARLERVPQGAAPTEVLYRILELLFSERDAALVSRLPVLPFPARVAARRWSMAEAEARAVLDDLAGRALLLDIRHDGRQLYVLPPPMAGFFEFTMMRVRDDLDQALLAELYHQYVEVEDDFVRLLFTEGETRFGRALVSESAVERSGERGAALHVLDHDRASHLIREASHVAVGLCYCRHKAAHLGTACDAPQDVCLTLNNVAAALVRHGHARRIDAGEALEIVARCRELGLVQFGENAREGVNFICNCCKCCCAAMMVARRWGFLHPVHTTPYLPELSWDDCRGCGRCVERCPVDALQLVSAGDPARPKRRKVHFEPEGCLGCGVCVGACRHGALTLVERSERVIPPLNAVHRTVLAALEQGKLPNLLFDDPEQLTHRTLGAVMGAILQLGPVQRATASEQLRSRYLDHFLQRFYRYEEAQERDPQEG